MGKKIIIYGADFSKNGFPALVETDLVMKQGAINLTSGTGFNAGTLNTITSNAIPVSKGQTITFIGVPEGVGAEVLFVTDPTEYTLYIRKGREQGDKGSPYYEVPILENGNEISFENSYTEGLYGVIALRKVSGNISPKEVTLKYIVE